MTSFLSKMKMRGSQSFHKDQRGSTAVEFAFVAPIFLGMMFGIYETGQILWTQSQIGFHVERAARIAAVDPDGVSNSEIQTEIESSLARLASGRFKVTVGRTAGAGDAPDIVQVDTEYQHQPITPLFPVRDLTMSHSAQFPLINQEDG